MYRSLADAVRDLERHGHLIRIKAEVDPDLEIAEIHRRIFAKGGPALLFENVKGSPFQAVSNIYGTFERTDFLFRKTIDKVRMVTQLKADPSLALRKPHKYWKAGFTALTALPRKSWGRGAVTHGQTTIDQLPMIKSWPMDGGAFITMPQVCTLPPGSKRIMDSNLGMYRIQLSGNDYTMNKEIGLHYQLHRGIGVHHTAYLDSDEDFRCSIFVGGPPSHAFSAIMPMPEGISEMTFAGMLAGRRFRYGFDDQGHLLSHDSDFVITGRIVKGKTMPEGPFGDHLGYYSLEHPFPVMEVDRVYYRKDALWHFSVVGRPPMEDSSFGYLIHKLVEALTPSEFPGLKSINAVDAAGVHPLLLAVGEERYMPFRDRVPEEVLTIATRLLGSGQTSLAKFLMIAAADDDPSLGTEDIGGFFDHFLRRVRWERDLHFMTKTTIDTLDYSGSGWNAGSKVIMACRGDVQRELGREKPSWRGHHSSINKMQVARPGVLALEVGGFADYASAAAEIADLAQYLESEDLADWPLILLVDDADFVAAHLDNFLWVAFTRANPSHDLHGVGSFIEHKHWGCTGPLIIDARIKPHHAPQLIEDPAVSQRVDTLFARDAELGKWG